MFFRLLYPVPDIQALMQGTGYLRSSSGTTRLGILASTASGRRLDSSLTYDRSTTQLALIMASKRVVEDSIN